jgi:hypothetical protein
MNVLLPAGLHNHGALLAALSRKDLAQISHILESTQTHADSATANVFTSAAAVAEAAASVEAHKHSSASSHHDHPAPKPVRNDRTPTSPNTSASDHSSSSTNAASAAAAAPLASTYLAAVCEHLGNVTASDLPCSVTTAAVQQYTLAKVTAVALALAWNLPTDAPVLETRLQLLEVQVKSCGFSKVCYSLLNRASVRKEVHAVVKRYLQPANGVWPEEYERVEVTVPAMVIVAMVLAK